MSLSKNVLEESDQYHKYEREKEAPEGKRSDEEREEEEVNQYDTLSSSPRRELPSMVECARNED